MNTTNDIHFISKTLAGETSAFSVLVDRYKDFVFTITLRMVKRREDAEEVAQDVFLKAFRSLKNFKAESKFSTWLYRIAYNTCLDHLKKHKKAIQTVEINDITSQEIKTLENALATMERQEYLAAIKNCLLRLPDDEGFIVTLYYFEELSIEEIAATTQLSKSNVKVKLFRSRKKLFSILSTQLKGLSKGTFK